MKEKRLDNQRKTEFENLLFDLNRKKQISHQKHNDFNHEKNIITVLHLYYNERGHIGTWTEGKCWIFPDHLGDKSMMPIEEIKEMLVKDEIDYVRDLVLKNKYDELYKFIMLYCFNDFKTMSEEEIEEQYEWRFGFEEEGEE